VPVDIVALGMLNCTAAQVLRNLRSRDWQRYRQRYWLHI